jgi:hypothetical protein
MYFLSVSVKGFNSPQIVWTWQPPGRQWCLYAARRKPTGLSISLNYQRAQHFLKLSHHSELQHKHPQPSSA